MTVRPVAPCAPAVAPVPLRTAPAPGAAPFTTTEIGVVIGVPEPHASLLAWWRRQVGDPLADMVWPHITLVPPTLVARESMAAVEDHLAAVAAAAAPFVMHLSGTGSFRPVSPVVFVQVALGLGSCELLERAVRGGPIVRDLEFPYHPHVTVAHGVGDADLDRAYEGLSGFAARFPVGGFQLFERTPTGTWTQLREFPLGPPAGDPVADPAGPPGPATPATAP